MNFEKYEDEISNFFKENFGNLKRTKVSNSERAFKELLLTEHADTNNAIRNIMKKVITAARADFVNMTDELKGYELGEQFKKAVKIPQLEMIKVDFSQKASSTTSSNTTNQSQQSTKKGYENFKQNSPVHQAKKNAAVIMAGVAAAGTIVVGTPLLTALTPLGLGTSLLIVGVSAIVIGGIVYTIFNVQNENGILQKVEVQQQTSRPGEAKPMPAQTIKKTMDKASVDNLLDARKLEAELAIKKAIQYAEAEYNKLIAQLNS
ncbi:hypothetical protein FC756_03605 [Lysinibacillus mangiferihumi]|uniref:Uncharacterized protein n=1 Tax=Lysinibacillus mangiferihumi TaxID=1130819 RepID=A0A4U2ZDQ1_9BACI|nr:hypothetical protein [Lysinibacillus mangiferihumi]TKI71892.1 hypothetical protein FC756_03605 [Lysinibacillus mangiferihumi]